MFNRAAKKLDNKLNQRKKLGKLSFAEEGGTEEEIRGLLEVADRLAAIQMAEVPTPTKRHLYIETLEAKQNRHFRMKLVKIFAWPASLAVMALVATHTYNQTSNSLPGSKLFSIKRMSEKAGVWKASNDPQKLALAQIELTQRRLAETSLVLSSNQLDSAVKSRALQELNDQAQVAFPLIRLAINEQQDANSPVVKNLENLNQKIAALPKESVTENKDLALTTELTETSQKTTDDVLHLLGAASDAETITLKEESNVEVTGKLNSYKQNSLIVEKTVFTYDPQKIIITKNKEKATLKDLSLKQTVVIKAIREEDGKLRATELNITADAPKETKPKVEETPKLPEPTPETPTEEVKEPSLGIKQDNNETNNTDPQKLQAGLIIEDPNPTK